MDDKQSISRLKQGDLHGLENLVKNHQAKAIRTAYLILFDQDQAEDVVQSAFLKAAARIQQFDASRVFGPWFMRIVVNDALKVVRRQKRLVSLEAELDNPVTQLAKWLTAPEPQPEQALTEQETREHLLAAIHSLPPNQRAAVVMRYYLGMSMQEMVTDTGRPLSTIKWWLREGRKRLQKLMHHSQGELLE